MVQQVDPFGWGDALTADGKQPSTQFIRQWQNLIQNVADLRAAVANITALQGNVSSLQASPYVTVGNTATLSAERALVAGAGVTITDNGANGNVSVAASLASTTEQLTGTSASKESTPDSVAALWEQGNVTTPSAGVLTLGEGGYFHIGAGNITDIDFTTDKAGRKAKLVFDGNSTLVYNASTLILPTSGNISAVVGDTCEIVSEGSDVIRVTDFQRADGTQLAPPGTGVPGSGTVTTVSVTTKNGVSGTVANPTTTPAITIKPDSMNHALFGGL